MKFQHDLLMILSKLGQTHTLQQGVEEIKALMSNDIVDNERMVFFLHSLTDFNSHMQLFQMKEQIKVYALAAEIFEEALVPYLPKILGTLQKQLKEDASARLHGAISETIGLMTQHIVSVLETHEERKILFETSFLRFSNTLIEKHPNKLIQ